MPKGNLVKSTAEAIEIAVEMADGRFEWQPAGRDLGTSTGFGFALLRMSEDEREMEVAIDNGF